MLPYLLAAFAAGSAVSIPLSFWLLRGFRFRWQVRRWRFEDWAE